MLFLVGPTGVGKTELAKAIDRARVRRRAARTIRFDMSEFSAEHADERLIGAPPGYVGHDAGGELTNAVRAQPFSVLLFDEIEKAHPKILDKFLQILEDGRLTDGQGPTVHFSECLIVFTSNLGIVQAAPTADPGAQRRPGQPYDPTSRRSGQAPSGTSPTAPEPAGAAQPDRRQHRRLRLHQPRGRPTDRRSPGAQRRLPGAGGVGYQGRPRAAGNRDAACPGHRQPGLRRAGIGNMVESSFVNPLARALFARQALAGDSVTVADLRTGATGPEVLVR